VSGHRHPVSDQGTRTVGWSTSLFTAAHRAARDAADRTLGCSKDDPARILVDPATASADRPNYLGKTCRPVPREPSRWARNRARRPRTGRDRRARRRPEHGMAAQGLLTIRELEAAEILRSPEGGRVRGRALSDPRESRSGARKTDLEGRAQHPGLSGILEATPALRYLRPEAYDALVGCGGQGPIPVPRPRRTSSALIARLYEARKPTAGCATGHARCSNIPASPTAPPYRRATMTGFAKRRRIRRPPPRKADQPFRSRTRRAPADANSRAGGAQGIAVRDMKLNHGASSRTRGAVAEWSSRTWGD